LKSFSLILFLILSQSKFQEEAKILKKNPEKADSIISIWVKSKDTLLPYLIDAFKNPETDIFIKQKIAIAFSKIKDEALLPYLYEGIKSGSSTLRRNCIIAVGEIRDTSGFEKVASLLGDKNDAVRGAVIEALDRINPEKAKPYLIKSLEDPAFLNRAKALTYLSKTGDKNLLPVIIKLKDDKNPLVRTSLAKSLAYFKDTLSFKVLKELLNDENPMVRKEAILSITKNFSERSIELIKDFVNDPDFSIRERVVHILQEVPPEVSIPLLYSFLKDPEQRIREKVRTLINEMENREKGFIVILKGDYPLEQKRWAFKNLTLTLGKDSVFKELSKIYEKEKLKKIMEGKYEKGMTQEEVYISIGKPARIRKKKGVEEWDYDSLKITLKFKKGILNEIERISHE